MLSFQEMFKKLTEITPKSWSIMLGMIGISIVLALLLRKEKRFDARKLTYGSLCVALAFILSYIRLYKMPQGGSVTLGSMIPIIFYAFMFGPRPGVIAGMVYGGLQFIQEPFAVHWFQVLLDYPFAFGALGLAGYFKKNLPLGVVVGIFGRFLFQLTSGVFFFASYAPPEQSPLAYSMLYNGTYLAVELGIVLVIVLIPQFRNALTRIKSETI